MKPDRTTLEAVADWHNLAAAFFRAARGKRGRADVEAFRANLFAELSVLQRDILHGEITVGVMTRFRIYDPKPRTIHAPVFRERVLHHALMAKVGPVLDRALVFDTYACRIGKGALAAVQRAQQHVQRFPWYAKIDIRAYFASIDHARLKTQLARRFRDHDLLALLVAIIDSHRDAPGKGLPIGALTSQHCANFYLSPLDRLLLEQCRVSGYVRYMDDGVWWGQSRESVRSALADATALLNDELKLEIKQPIQIGRSVQGLSFCGYRILPSALKLSRRRKRRYCEGRQRWESAYARGEIDSTQLQAGYAAIMGMTCQADAAAWRREQLRRQPLAPDLVLL